MSWSFDISGGDLNLISPKSGMSTVTGARKAFQDIRAELLESMGNDPMHPEYGSVLDGGVMPDGRLVESEFGNIIDSGTIYRVELELRRIIEEYAKRQKQKLLSERQRSGGKHTFAANELVASIDSIDTKQINDTLLVRIRLLMSNGGTIQIFQVV